MNDRAGRFTLEAWREQLQWNYNSTSYRWVKSDLLSLVYGWVRFFYLFYFREF